jgi:hypothetical protein
VPPARRCFYANLEQRLDVFHFIDAHYGAAVLADGYQLAFLALRQLDMLELAQTSPRIVRYTALLQSINSHHELLSCVFTGVDMLLRRLVAHPPRRLRKLRRVMAGGRGQRRRR